MEHETLLPPPPTARIVVWAEANRLGYRAFAAVLRALAALARRGRRVVDRIRVMLGDDLVEDLDVPEDLPAPPPAPTPRPADDRATAVAVRRPPRRSGPSSRRSRVTRVSSPRPAA